MFKTFRIKMVGCNFQKPQIKPAVHDVIKIKLEPENDYDKDAIAIFNHNGEKIGYVGTDNTVSQGNKANGCLTNLELKKIVDFEDNNSYLGIITKFKGYFGFIDITVIDDI